MQTVEELLQAIEEKLIMHEDRVNREAIGMVNKLITEKGLNYSDLGRRLGISRSHVSKIINGARLSLKSLVRITSVLGKELHISIKDD